MGQIDRVILLERLAVEFPSIAYSMAESGLGILHLEVAIFRGFTEAALESGREWEAEKHFRFFDKVLTDSNPEVENALRISYLEDLALGEYTPDRRRIIHERMPPRLVSEMKRIHPNWR